MATTKKATYKRYNGTDWDAIAFATYASVVTVDVLTSAHYVSVSMTASDALSALDAQIYSLRTDLADAGTQLTSLEATVASQATDIANLKSADTSLSNRIATIEGAYSDGTIITTSNMGEKITKVGTVNSGTWQGTAIADSYIASASKWNQNVTDLGTLQTTVKDNKTELEGKISDAVAIAQGKTNTYVIEATLTTSGYSNTSFNIAQTSETSGVTVQGRDKIIDVNGNAHSISELKIGDILITRESTIKDFFLGKYDKETEFYSFYEIDSDKPDLTDYAKTSAVTSAINSAIQALDSSTDAGSGKYLQAITIADGKIASASTGTIPTSLPASNVTDSYSSTSSGVPISGKGVDAALSQSLTPTFASANGIKVGMSGTIQSPSPTVEVTEGSIASGNTGVVTGGTVYSHVLARATKIYYETSASNADRPRVGDICIEYK